jgi:hypothetical protein
MAGRNLTDMQKKYIHYLVHEGLSATASAEKAGYKSTSTVELNDNLREEIIAETELYLATHVPTAARKLVEHMGEGAIEPGSEKRLEAIKQILDRTGLTKRERPQNLGGTQLGIVFLPPKQEDV